jgi:hypothetical protein
VWHTTDCEFSLVQILIGKSFQELLFAVGSKSEKDHCSIMTDRQGEGSDGPRSRQSTISPLDEANKYKFPMARKSRAADKPPIHCSEEIGTKL